MEATAILRPRHYKNDSEHAASIIKAIPMFIARSAGGESVIRPNAAPVAIHPRSTTTITATHRAHLAIVSAVANAGSKTTNEPKRETNAR